MFKFKKIIALIVTFCMISTLTPNLTALAYMPSASFSFPVYGEDNYDADKVFFEGDTLEFSIDGLSDEEEYRVEFGIMSEYGDFISAPVGTDCISDDYVSNYIAATTSGGAITIVTQIDEDLDSGEVAVKIHNFDDVDWDDIFGDEYYTLQEDTDSYAVMVGLDSTFEGLPTSPDELIEGVQAGYWMTDSMGDGIMEVDNLYDISAIFGKVIYDEDGDYSTYDDMTYGTISFDSLNFMDSDLMESLGDIFSSISMEQEESEDFENFTIGMDTTESGLDSLAEMEAIVSLTSPYFEGKDLTADAFTVEGADDEMGVAVYNQSFEDDTYTFDVTHFSDYDVELTYYYYIGTTSTTSVTITLLDRYLDEVDGYVTTSDEDGSFELTGVPAGKYYLEFVGAGENEYFSPLSSMWDTAQDGNISDEYITMIPFEEYTFTITDGNGDPIEGASIVFDTYNSYGINASHGIDAVTGEDGTVTTSAIEEGSYKVVKDGYKTVKGSVSITNKTLKKLSYLTLTADKTIDIDFDEEVTFTATLEDSDGTGISDQSITFTGYIDGTHKTLSSTTDSDGTAYFVVSVTGEDSEDADCYAYYVSFSGEDNYYSATSFSAPIVVGVSETPISITTAEELAAIDDTAVGCVSNYILANDIDLTDYISDNSDEWDSIDEFCGVFDGNGKTISGLSGYRSLFEDIYAPAVIRDFDIEVVPGENEDDFDETGIFADEIGEEDEGPITVENINISGSTYNDDDGTTASFATGVYGIATISDCHVDVDITTTELYDYYSGGFIGFSGGNGNDYSDTTDILIKDCSFTGSFNGGDSSTPVYIDDEMVLGGFIGDNNIGSVVEDCYASISMLIYFDDEDARVGGFAGRNAGSISGSYSTGTLNVVNEDSDDVDETFVGGLVGRNVGTVENCFANMDITVEATSGGTVGGLMGSDTGKSLINSYSTGTINAVADDEDDIYIGGVIGSFMVKSDFWYDYFYDDVNTSEPTLFESLSNTYYDSDISDVGIGAIYDYNAYEYYLVYDEDGEAESKEDSSMKTKSFASTLNNGQSPKEWNSLVSSSVNDGYPVPSWVSVTVSSSAGSSTTYYKVTFNTNGGSSVDSTSKVAKNTKISEPRNPTKNGYEFVGWFEDSSLTNEFDFSSRITSNMTLYAKWSFSDDMGDVDDGSQYFDDVTEETYPWAIEAIDYLSLDEVVNGIGNNNYGPSLKIIRGDFTLMLVRAFDLQSESSDNFTDVSDDSYYRDAISVAKDLGIAKGYGENFIPLGELTRQDAMVLVYRTLELKGITLTSGSMSDLSMFVDAYDVSDYAVDAVSALVKAGMINGDGENLYPKSKLSRAEMAVILYRVLQL
jgi:uncharacterized repeat protein (TIGR02543 family)